MRALGYFRDVPGSSLAEQSEEFLAFCEKNGYEAAAAFLDSKTAADRPGFRQLVEFIRQQPPGGFLLVVVLNMGVLGDEATESARRYFQLASLGVQVLSMENGEELSATLLEQWSERRAAGSLGDRVKAAMRRRAIKGEALGRPPYGYRVGPRRRLEVVPEEGSVVRYIFRLYLKDGLGIRRIARRLNEEGLRTRRNGLWSMVTVRDILRNRAYIGTYSRFGVRVPASHPPLISKEDFQLVQEKLDQRKPAGDKRAASPFLLSGLLYCGQCGNKMIGVTRRQRWRRRTDGELRTAEYRYYQCESRTNRSLCDYHTWRAEKLEEAVRTALLTGAAARRQASANGAEGARGEDEVRRLRDKARRLDRRLEQYLEAAAAGGLSPDKLRNLGVALASEQLRVEDDLAQSTLASRIQASEEQRDEYRRALLARLREDWASMEFSELQELLRELVERIIVRDEGVEPVLAV